MNDTRTVWPGATRAFVKPLSCCGGIGTGAAAGALGLSLWPQDRPVVRDLPRMVLLEPQPFEHRLDGDWRQAGRSTDAPVRTARIPAPIEIMETPVSTGQWLDCVAAGACLAPSGPADRPDRRSRPLGGTSAGGAPTR